MLFDIRTYNVTDICYVIRIHYDINIMLFDNATIIRFIITKMLVHGDLKQLALNKQFRYKQDTTRICFNVRTKRGVTLFWRIR